MLYETESDMDEKEKNENRLDDDILRCREDIQRLKKQNESASNPDSESSPETETPKEVSQNNTQPGDTQPVIQSFDDISAKKQDTQIEHPIQQDLHDHAHLSTDENNDTAHAFAELLAGGPADESENESENDSDDETEDVANQANDDHDPLAIIGNAVKMAQLEHPQEDDPPKTQINPIEPEINETPSVPDAQDKDTPQAELPQETTSTETTATDTPQESAAASAPEQETPAVHASQNTEQPKSDTEPAADNSKELDIDFDDDENDGLDDDFEQLEKELHDLGIASDEDDGHVMLQQTPPEPETAGNDEMLKCETGSEPEHLTEEEQNTLTSELSEVKQLLNKQDESEFKLEDTVPKFDLADQILAEHRKLASAKRQPPSRTVPTPNIPPATGTVADVIDENKKSSITDVEPTQVEKEEPAPQPQQQTPEPPAQKSEPPIASPNSCSPAVQSIINNDDELTEFQKQILAELVERDIELHSRENLRKKTQSLRFKKNPDK